MAAVSFSSYFPASLECILQLPSFIHLSSSSMNQAAKEGPAASGDPMILTSVVNPILTKLGEKNPSSKAAIETLKKDFEGLEKANPGFTHNFVSEILDLMKSRK
jgi:hypothetical protein